MEKFIQEGNKTMLCTNCNKNEAELNIPAIINGVPAEFNLCMECSQNMIKDVAPVSIDNLIKGVVKSIHSMTGGVVPVGSIKLGAITNHKQKRRKASGPCLVCDLTYEEFKSSGKLGCEACFRVFSKEIVALIENVQGSTKHEGKFPKRFGTVMRQQREVSNLRTNLERAINDENFEEAARLRDQIRDLEVLL